MKALPQKASDVFTSDEIRELTEASNFQGFVAIVATWGLVAASLLAVAIYPSVVTVLVALVIIGGRHLAMAVLTHEAAHRSLFKTKSLNETVAFWLCAAPGFHDLLRYRTHHIGHHAHAGTDKDPDLSLIEPFPTTGRSLVRKFLRDLAGISAYRRILGMLGMSLGYIEYTASTDVRRIEDKLSVGHRMKLAVRHLGPGIVTNAIFLAVLWGLGHPELFLLWVGAWFTTYSLFLRIRAIAEHACTGASSNPFENTRTTIASPLAKLTIAPMNVNYHLEHHLLMTVPYHKLPRMHAILAERGFLEEAHVSRGYRDVMAAVTR